MKTSTKVTGSLAIAAAVAAVVMTKKGKSGFQALPKFVRESGLAQRQAFIAWLHTQKGKPYIWGGANENGYDCSGLVQVGYSKIGKSIPRQVTEQSDNAPNIQGFPKQITIAEAVAFCSLGDCIGLDYTMGGRFDHVIVYIGNNKFIQATGGQSCPNHPSSECKVIECGLDRFTNLGAVVRTVYSYFDMETVEV